jgi:DNA repair protein RAD50
MMVAFSVVTVCCNFQQRATGTSSAEHMKVLEMVKSDAEDFFKQLDDLRGIYDEYIKLGKETIPLAEKDLEQHLADESEKAQTFEDVSHLLLAQPYFFSYTKYG